MYNLIVKNKQGTYGEILTDFDIGSFKYEYEKNNERSISFTAYKSSNNADIFDSLVNEAIVNWKGQDYVIKSTAVKSNNVLLSNEVVAKHIFLDFQNHYIEKKDNSNDDSTDDTSSDTTTDEEKPKPQYSLQEYLDFGFKDNPLGFTYEIVGKFDKKVGVEELGNKNGIEYLTEGAELFGYIYFADNKKIYIYDEESFYKRSDEVLIYKYNTDEVQATTSTTDLKTIIKGYGKKKTDKETKNYSPQKPKDLTYSGKFIKEGTWRTEEIGASYSKEIECKWGNETLTWKLKRMSKGGLLDVYLDDKKVGSYDCYSKRAKSEDLVISKNLAKGKHTFKAVFKGAKSGVDYKKSKPCMYVGTEASTVLNITANLSGNDLYHAYTEYKSPNYEIFGHAQAPTVTDDNITNNEDLVESLKAQLNDQPTVELDTNYLGFEQIKENNTIRLVHRPLGINLDLKVIKITEPHPLVKQPTEVEFSNASKDIIQIQQKIFRDMKNVNTAIKDGALKAPSFVMPENYSDIVGVTLIDE